MEQVRGILSREDVRGRNPPFSLRPASALTTSPWSSRAIPAPPSPSAVTLCCKSVPLHPDFRDPVPLGSGGPGCGYWPVLMLYGEIPLFPSPRPLPPCSPAPPTSDTRHHHRAPVRLRPGQPGSSLSYQTTASPSPSTATLWWARFRSNSPPRYYSYPACFVPVPCALVRYTPLSTRVLPFLPNNCIPEPQYGYALVGPVPL